MSTRCNIKIVTDDQTVYLYRHMDGYPAETGADVYEVAKSFDGNSYNYLPAWMAAVNRFMKYCYEGDDLRKARPMYELTDAAHGDIEHFYVIKVGNYTCPHNDPNCKECKPKCFAMVYHVGGYGPELEDQCNTNENGMTPAEFAEVVNADRREINTRIAQLRKQNPGLYGDYTDYPMVS